MNRINSLLNHIQPTAASLTPLSQYGQGTIENHADVGIESISDIAPPLHLTSTYHTHLHQPPYPENSPHSPEDYKLVYSRYDSQTRRRVEAVLAAIEKNSDNSQNYCLTYSSGLSAILALFTALQPQTIYTKIGYFGTKEVLNLYNPKLNQLSDQDFHNLAQGGAQSPRLDIIWLETPANTSCDVHDIEFYARVAKEHNSILIVDSTFSTPIGLSPLQLGADIVMHSATKYLSGHADLLGGSVVFAANNTKINGKSFFLKLFHQRSIAGNVQGNLESWLLLRSLRTLSLRVHKQSESSLKVVEFLLQQRVLPLEVLHPINPNHNSHQIYKKLTQEKKLRLTPSCFSIVLADGVAAQKFCASLKLFKQATSLGSVESLVDWRYLHDKSVSPGLLRLSIGVEEAQDLIDDIKQALQSV
jgi:cystathionine beta-lyase/cystathionine gamma-synthase